MTPEQRAAIRAFHKSVEDLRAVGAVRSHRYLGDIAEFLCADKFQINLATNLRQVGHDGMRGELRAQVKYGGGKKTNIDLGDPTTYDEVYVVLGRESVVRSWDHSADFIIYMLTSAEVLAIGPTNGGKYSCGRSYIHREPNGFMSLLDASA